MMNQTTVDLPLRDIHLPDSVLASGPSLFFWLFLLGLGVCLFLSFWMANKKRLKPTLKKEAKKMLQEITLKFDETQDAAKCVMDLSILLRRVVLSKASSQINCAAITGKSWLQLLDQPLKEPEFSQGIGQLLLTAPYLPKVENSDAIKLLSLCSKWVEAL